jgi:hypothetical protein
VVGLKGRGFEAPAGGKNDLATQLIAALKVFQQANGLPVNGQLNAQTMLALKNAGVVGDPAQLAAQTKQAEKDGFEKGPTLLSKGDKLRADAVKLGTPDTNFLDALLNQLGTGGPNEGTSASDVKGAAHANEAQSQQVDKSKVAEAKKAENAQKKGSAADARDNELATPQQRLDKGTGIGVKVNRGLRASETRTSEKKRNAALAGEDPTELGILDEEADPEALEGAGDDGDKKRGRGGEHAGGQAEGEETSASAGGAGDGNERDRGNASSGDQDHDAERRGDAQMGDEEGAGHYRMATVSEQAFAALTKIARDAAVENRATTYSWDVTFYKPGVYGAGQQAQELVHLVVDKATAFDPVWHKAQANLTALVSRTDPGGHVPSLDDIIQAIRQARAREGDESAGKLTKFTRPVGRA